MDMIRWLVIGELLTLLLFAFWLHAQYIDTMPQPLLWLGRCLLSVVAVVAFAVMVNALLDLAATPGAYVIAFGSLPATSLAGFLVLRGLKRDRAERNSYRRAVAHLAHLEPCSNPECVNARAELADIAARYR